MYYQHVSSPIGKLLLTSDGKTLTGIHTSRRAEASGSPTGEAWKQDNRVFARVRDQLDAYFEGHSPTFDVAMDLKGTPFQQRVWAALLAIPYGAAISYAELARRIGQPAASRAVGGANGQNPISIIVPCHRVIAADGGLGGYGGGLDLKRWLLEHEAEALARHPEWLSAPHPGAIVPKLLRA